jgi:hypothetical protein
MTVCSRPEIIMKEAVKGCITMTSQLSLKIPRPKCITVIQDGWDTGFKPVIF